MSCEISFSFLSSSVYAERLEYDHNRKVVEVPEDSREAKAYYATACKSVAGPTSASPVLAPHLELGTGTNRSHVSVIPAASDSSLDTAVLMPTKASQPLSTSSPPSALPSTTIHASPVTANPPTTSAPSTSSAPAKLPPPKRPVGGGLKALTAPKPKKLSTLDKSRLDWKSHVESSDKDARDELEANRRGGGYIEKVEFLGRVEGRVEEKREEMKGKRKR